ncbi:MAG: dual specificity protein phosphatase family protein [Candidatus Heimdallarchaeota archaeon]|nr:MAG: dual specificity protein phosphatase family protein [Candidatus Heimdallarchaeota archaeon]
MRITWIIPNQLAASGTPLDKNDVRQVVKQGIRAIVTATEYSLVQRGIINNSLLKELDIDYLNLEIPDNYGPTLVQSITFSKFSKKMESRGRPLLIHCMAGVGRTGTLLHLYFLSRGHSLEQAAQIIRKHRPQNILLSEDQVKTLVTYLDSR